MHLCNGPSETLNNEDIVHFHRSFQNTDGTITQGKGPTEAMWSGVVNRLQGTLAGVMGGEFEDLTRRGVRSSTHRQRQKEAYKEIPNVNY